jgi:hypothetical protein
VWLYFIVALLPITIAWSLTNPMFGSPDENTHLIRAQGVVRGDLSSPYRTDGISGGVCFAFDGNITADCQNLTWDASRVTDSENADEYPPLFHFVAGIPNLFVSGLGGAYLTRMWLAGISSSLLALAAGLLWTWRPHPWITAGCLLGWTPMVIFLSATVNPSGLTVALASVIWASGIIIVSPGTSARKSVAYPLFLVTASLFPLLRRDALFFEMVIFVVLFSLTRRTEWRSLIRQRWLQVTALCVIVSGTLTFLIWSGSAASSFAAGADDSGNAGLFAGLGDLQYYLLSVMGWFGWLDSPMTNETYMVATVVLGTAIMVAIAGASGVHLRGVLLCLLAVLAIPVVIGMVRYPYFQGRYLLPLTVGLFMLSGIALSEAAFVPRTTSRLILILLSLWAGVHFFAFAQNLRRYATGVRGSWNIIQNSVWSPPVFGNAVALLFAAGSIALSGTVVWKLSGASRSIVGADQVLVSAVPASDRASQLSRGDTVGDG